MAKPINVAATNNVEASAPHLVLRFQNRAAIMTGAIAANPEKGEAHRDFKDTPCFSLR